uniref:BEACH domain-containing protein n=1 Tax=Mycena chlorophos TaxID=658473 RepID=A0ABQ0LG62_MYCCL|nr:predicted protein [Mycena chlorophos]
MDVDPWSGRRVHFGPSGRLAEYREVRDLTRDDWLDLLVQRIVPDAQPLDCVAEEAGAFPSDEGVEGVAGDPRNSRAVQWSKDVSGGAPAQVRVEEHEGMIENRLDPGFQAPGLGEGVLRKRYLLEGRDSRFVAVMAHGLQAPPRPKPGSLRDRNAAFEKPNASADNNTAPPQLCPKVDLARMEPKPPSLKTPPAGSAGLPSLLVQLLAKTSYEMRPGCLQATRKSRLAGSKDRMAALQGRGGYGAPPPPVAPKPVVETGKKWLPPKREGSVERKEETAGDGDEEKDKPKGDAEDEANEPEEVDPANAAQPPSRLRRLQQARPLLSRSPWISPPMPTQTPSSLGFEPSTTRRRFRSGYPSPSTDFSRNKHRRSLAYPTTKGDANAGCAASCCTTDEETTPPAPEPDPQPVLEQAEATEPAVVEQIVETADEKVVVVVKEEDVHPVLDLATPPAPAATAIAPSVATPQLRDETPEAEAEHDVVPRPVVETSVFVGRGSEYHSLRQSLSARSPRLTSLPLRVPGLVGVRASSPSQISVGEGNITSSSVVQAFAEEVWDAEIELEVDEDAIFGAPSISEPEPIVEVVVEPESAIIKQLQPAEDEGEEAAKKRRVMERMAKMGGLNRFAARLQESSLKTPVERQGTAGACAG